jgi:hypothetical protein
MNYWTDPFCLPYGLTYSSVEDFAVKALDFFIRPVADYEVDEESYGGIDFDGSPNTTPEVPVDLFRQRMANGVGEVREVNRSDY